MWGTLLSTGGGITPLMIGNNGCVRKNIVLELGSSVNGTSGPRLLVFLMITEIT